MKALNNRFRVKFMQLEIGLLKFNSPRMIIAYQQQKKTSEKHNQSENPCFLKIFGTILNFVRNLTFPGVP